MHCALVLERTSPYDGIPAPIIALVEVGDPFLASFPCDCSKGRKTPLPVIGHLRPHERR